MSEGNGTGRVDEIGPERGAGRIYFPELDGLRFFAFMLVYLFHGGIESAMLSPFVGRAVAAALREKGWVGVELFFILSGYLITTLLLREEDEFGRIDLQAFWIRRILRIWPLYYLTVAIGFLLIPWVEGTIGTPGYRELLANHLAPFLGFLGNWSMSLIGPVPYDALSVLWSVCVEEQFYLFVPLLVAWVGRRYRLGLVVVLILATVLARYFFSQAYPVEIKIRFNTFMHLDTLLSGVLLALVFGPTPGSERGARWARWLQWPLLLGTIWLFAGPQLGVETTERRTWDFVWIWVWGVALVAIVVSSRGWLRASLAYSRFVWLGKISYGLYMYHEVAIWGRRSLEHRLPWFPNKDALLTIATFAATVGLAALSYYAFERRFLALKRFWTRVPSRPV
ncbi:acyltransferase family protein [Singulisphaera acidiphila]|uniref:Putative acyltransferase n=1 Tax=Singulisphaera acidiphila (strain ATCC BAA-1392 / DSM 18658 / VKM B-2454 / MOB10) TaxID=886293 RepID=L0DAZ4_SINAD|nr:acyltransferase [Singulisphaera acidiphila]AGA26008.1 putative acyltransferase [Singulisphaera acidiphila DSM 18658]